MSTTKEDKQVLDRGLLIWATIATVVAIYLLFGASAGHKWYAVMGENATYTITDVIEESEANDEITSIIVEQYNQLSENAQNECSIVTEYFGDEAGDHCYDTVFDGVQTEISGGDISSSARDGLKEQLDYALNPPSSD